MGRGGESERRHCAPAPDQAAGEAGATRGDEGGENEEAWRRGGRAGRAGASPTTPSLTAALRWRSRRGPVGSGRIWWEIARKRWIWKEDGRSFEHNGWWTRHGPRRREKREMSGREKRGREGDERPEGERREWWSLQRAAARRRPGR
ncbi:hypothetical protein VPH35_020039 [Triticum aestivum]